MRFTRRGTEALSSARIDRAAALACAIVLTGCARSAPPSSMTLFYELSCHACYEGLSTETLLGRASELRAAVPDTHIELVDVMIPGNTARFERLAVEHGAKDGALSPPVLFVDGAMVRGYQAIAEYLARVGPGIPQDRVYPTSDQSR